MQVLQPLLGTAAADEALKLVNGICRMLERLL